MIALVALTALLVYAAVVCRLLHGLRALRPQVHAARPRVSVVCAARNEAHNLDALLSCLMAQSYPPELLEVVIVDDRSSDGSAALLARWRAAHPRVKVVHLEELGPGIGAKKNALAHGIAAATGEILLLTDADCRPSPRWAEEMVGHFAAEVGLVAGFAPLLGEGVLAGVVAVDTLASALVAAGGVGLHRPTTCTGRNLAFRRQAYAEVEGYQKFMYAVSGDDDLLLHQVSQRTDWQVQYAVSPATFVPSAAPRTLRQLLAQRRRHLSAGRYYPAGVKARYALLHLCNLCLFVAPVWAALGGSGLPLCSLLLCAKVAVDLKALLLAGRAFAQRFSWWAFCLWEMYFVLTNVLLGPLSWLGRIRWRE
ncbi:MAG: glycosyltransferase [bacterium]|nr:glycosyltransferase [candidate division KSB1 bacterium]MDH7559966.1 glycosyltransferase [bacterium]